jgi:hypothetical protein
MSALRLLAASPERRPIGTIFQLPFFCQRFGSGGGRFEISNLGFHSDFGLRRSFVIWHLAPTIPAELP